MGNPYPHLTLSSLPDVLPIRPLSRPIEAVVHLPGSKSYTNRALIVASLAGGGASRLGNPLQADDSEVMRDCLRGLGVVIDDSDDPWLVLGNGGRLTAPRTPLNVGASGTTARFITAIATLADGPVTIDGTARLRQRPISDLTDALKHLGVVVKSSRGGPPLTIDGRNRSGRVASIDGRRSSQFVSALLMLGPMLRDGLEITVTGGLVSQPYVTSTLEVMRAFGAAPEPTASGYEVPATGYTKASYHIESDASAAAYPAIAVAICGGAVQLVGLAANSSQADMHLFGVLQAMGCVISGDAAAVTVLAPADGLAAVDTSMGDAPDAALALAVACMFADGPSRIRDLATLRLKETDRLAALETELNRLGAAASVEGDDLVIRPGEFRAARVRTYDDHRMAMAFAIAGLARPGIEIDDPGCVAKTWPGFFNMLESLR